MSITKLLPSRLLVVVAGLLALPFTIEPTTGKVTANDAACDGGTCCEEVKSICYPGSCSDPNCALDDHYWRGDGKKCEDPEG